MSEVDLPLSLVILFSFFLFSPSFFLFTCRSYHPHPPPFSALLPWLPYWFTRHPAVTFLRRRFPAETTAATLHSDIYPHPHNTVHFELHKTAHASSSFSPFNGKWLKSLKGRLQTFVGLEALCATLSVPSECLNATVTVWDDFAPYISSSGPCYHGDVSDPTCFF